jgi:hypothetical protein
MHWRIALIVAAVILLPSAARAQGTCSFLFVNDIQYLQDDCQTDTPIELGEGITFDGGAHTIEAIDAPDRPFAGGVIVARNRWAAVVNTTILTSLTAAVCLDGADVLRGIYFDGASGQIQNNTIAVSRPGVDCAEGNGIEVRNNTREGDPTTVLIKGNVLDRYQKTAVVVHGNVDATIDTNAIGSSTLRQLVPNGIQVGPRATARIQNNLIVGRFTRSPFGQPQGGAAILLADSGSGTIVDENTIEGASDVGIYVSADSATVTRNVVRHSDANSVSSFGIVNDGEANVFHGNVVTGFGTSTWGVESARPAGRGVVE